MTDKCAAIVLAAGKGKRMMSDLPKVLHQIDGRPMVRILLDTLLPIGFEKVVVVIGHKGELVKEALAGYPVEFAWQHEQLGTGHAVMMTEDILGDFEGSTLVAAGDVPYLSRESVEKLFAVHRENQAVATCLSAVFDDPTGYGRIIREGNSSFLKEIIEHKDASEEVQRIREINSGILCFDNRSLFDALEGIGRENSQGEYYLTDTIKIMHDKGLRVAVVAADNPDEVLGINSVDQLRDLAKKFADKAVESGK